jgi:hypothetical protein
MFEMALVALFVTVALLALGGKRVVAEDRNRFRYLAIEESSDLPCPWCRSATRESDRHCPTCGQRFG